MRLVYIPTSRLRDVFSIFYSANVYLHSVITVLHFVRILKSDMMSIYAAVYVYYVYLSL